MRKSLLVLILCILPWIAHAHPTWWVGGGGGSPPGAGTGDMNDVIDDTSPTLGGPLDIGTNAITGTGDIIVDDGTFDVLTYHTAISTCNDQGCGLQLPLLTGTPDNADSGDVRLYWVDGLLAAYDDAGVLGIPMMFDDSGPTTARAVPVFLDSTGSQLDDTQIVIDTSSVITGPTQIKFAAATSAARGVQFGEVATSVVASDADTLRIDNFGAHLVIVDEAGGSHRIVTNLEGGSTNNSIARWDLATGTSLQSTTALTADDNGNVSGLSFVSPGAVGRLDVGLTDAAAGSSIRLQEDTDAAGDFGAILAAGNLTYTADVTVAVGRITRSASAASGTPTAVIGAVSNAGTKSTCEELCSLAYAETSGPVAAAITGTCKKFGTTTPADNTVTFIAVGDEVENTIYFETTCSVE